MRQIDSPAAIAALVFVLFVVGCGEKATDGGLGRGVVLAAAAPPAPAAERTTGPAALARIPDVTLVDQDGRSVRFYSDLVKDRLVLVNAIYTTCSGTCPMQSAIFSGLQHRILDRLGKDVALISLSLDPRTDSPEKLKEFATRYGAHPGWTFLTGEESDVRTARECLGLDAPSPEQHAPIAVIGNERTGVWMKAVNLTSPDDLLKKLEHVEKLDPSRSLGSR